jgi:aspartyl/glutamyl-tRNA(Asn/Gln) amidotransferase C subunit
MSVVRNLKAAWSVKRLQATADAASALSEIELSRIATLAGLELASDTSVLRNDLSRIFHFVRMVQQVDTRGVEPLCALNDQHAAPLRADISNPDVPIAARAILGSAAHVRGSFFTAPNEAVGRSRRAAGNRAATENEDDQDDIQ